MTIAKTSLTAVAALCAWAVLMPPFALLPQGRTEAGGGASAAPQAERAAEDKGVAFVDSAAPALIAGSDRQVNGTVFVSNTGKDERTVSLDCTLRSALGRPIGPLQARLAAPNVPGSTPVFGLAFSLTLPEVSPDDFPMNGWMILRSTRSGAPDDIAGLPLRLEIKSVAGQVAGPEWWLVLFALVGAIAGMVIASGLATRKEGSGKRRWWEKIGKLWWWMGTPEWSFTESWSSTLTIAGGAVTSLLGFAALPEQGHFLAKKTYGVVSLLATALIGLAPGVYNLFRRRVQTGDPADGRKAQYQGRVLSFLAAGVFTMTGVLLQLGLLCALFGDIANTGLLSWPTARLFQVLCVGLLLVLLFYAVRSAVQTIDAESEEGKADWAGRRLDDWPLL